MIKPLAFLLAIVALLAGIAIGYFAFPSEKPAMILTLTCPANADGTDVDTVNIPFVGEDGGRLQLNCGPVE